MKPTDFTGDPFISEESDSSLTTVIRTQRKQFKRREEA